MFTLNEIESSEHQPHDRTVFVINTPSHVMDSTKKNPKWITADDGTLSRDSAQQKDLQPCYDITPEE